MLNDNELKKLKKCELIIADEIKRICEKNSIKYFLVGGSLLGAVRHKGFIPWDDDMDFGMPVEDYNRFKAVCKTELSDDFTLQDWDSDSEYPFPFCKIRLNSTVIDENFVPDNVKQKGVFVDIFPFADICGEKASDPKTDKDLRYLPRVLWMKKGYGKCIRDESLKQRLKYDVFRFMCLFTDYEKTRKKYEERLASLGGEKADSMFMVCTSYSLDKLLVKKSWVNEISQYEFEGREYPGFKEYDQYLTTMYGDYLTLPDEKDRHSHDIQSVDFGRFGSI